MALTNMKNDPEKKETMLAEVCCDSDDMLYPYGLRISLDEKGLAKLGLSEMPAMGTKMRLMAVVEVVGTNMSEYQSTDGVDEHKNLDLQITDMELTGESAGEKSMADKLYG